MNFIRRKSTIVLIDFIFVLSGILTGCSGKKQDQQFPEFEKFYSAENVTGSFVAFDEKNNQYYFYNPKGYVQSFIPGSTFKIPNSLIGLETGVIKDAHFLIAWDSVERPNPIWNKGHDLADAFQHSCVWYYQELARRVGGEKMKFWLDKMQYGNQDTSGGIDKFWLTGKLKISPKQQIELLKNLHDNKLPFSQRSMNIVKSIMIAKDTLGFVLRAKTGWASSDSLDIGWYVGYIEHDGNTIYFANRIGGEVQESEQPFSSKFVVARKKITFEILEELKFIPRGLFKP